MKNESLIPSLFQRQLIYIRIEKTKMKFKLSLFIFLLIGSIGYSQIEVNGVVKDEKTKTPLEEVRIQLKPISNKRAGYWTGTMTKESGRYKVSTSLGLPAVFLIKKKDVEKNQ